MLKSPYCLVHAHDLHPVALAGAVCLVAPATAFRMKAIGAASHYRSRPLWLGATGAIVGAVTAERLFTALGSADAPPPGSSKMAA
jgi:hypothetical protein